MSETNRSAEWAQDDKNQEVLRSAELGIVLERVYLDAVNQDPRLADMEIVPLDPDSARAAMARPAWKSETGKHQIHVRLDNLDDTLKKYEELMDTIPGARETFGSQLGLQSQEVTPQLLYIQSILHEMGHITEYMDFEDNPDALRDRNKREKAALPVGNMAVSKMITDGTAENNYVVENWSKITQRLGVNSMDELAEVQHGAYRQMTSEAHADNFATDVLMTHPDTRDILIAGDLGELRMMYDNAA